MQMRDGAFHATDAANSDRLTAEDALDHLTGRGRFLNESVPDWVRQPAVQALGLGPSAHLDRGSAGRAIRVYVDAWASIEHGGKSIPLELRLAASDLRVPIEVVAIGPLRRQAGNVRGGSVVFNRRHGTASSGAAACLLQEKGKPTRRFLLTCAHVLAPGGAAQVGDDIIAIDDQGQQQMIGNLAAWSTAGQTTGAVIRADAALVELTAASVLPDIIRIGIPSATTGRAPPGHTVKLYSPIAGKPLEFLVEDENFRIPDIVPGLSPPYFRYTDAVSCTPLSAATAAGDSGSAVLTADDRLVGMHFAGNDQIEIFCRLTVVCDHFANPPTSIPLEAVTLRTLNAGSTSTAPPPPPAVLPSMQSVALSPFVVPVESADAAVTTLAKTIWGEARGEPSQGRIAVAWVVVNRTRRQVSRWGMTVEKVCRQPEQFSCWNPGDPNLAGIKNLSPTDSVYGQCRVIAASVLKGEIPDPTKGSTHYHTGSVSPKWSRGKSPAVTIGAHHFFNNID